MAKESQPTSVVYEDRRYQALRRNPHVCEAEIPLRKGDIVAAWVPCLEPAAVEIEYGGDKTRFCRGCYIERSCGEPNIADLRELIGWKD